MADPEPYIPFGTTEATRKAVEVVARQLEDSETLASLTPARLRRIRELEASRVTLIAYLRMKLESADWHGCQDAASDLRDVDSELKGLRY